MKILMLFFLIPIGLFAQPEIKSLILYSTSQTSIPIGEQVTIEFDIKNDVTPQLKLSFYYCDSYWKPYDRFELENRGKNSEEVFDYSVLPVTVDGADYHFKRTYPNRRVTFPFSGKWIVRVTDIYENVIYAEGWFIIVYDSIDMRVNLKKDQVNSISSNNIMNKTLRLTTDVVLPEELEPFRVSHIEIIENHKFDYPIIVNRDKITPDRYFEWDADRKMKFVVKDIRPGNEYRKLDIRDKVKYPYPDCKAQYSGVETSRFYKKGRKDFNGGNIYVDPNEENGDYLNVTFEFRPFDKPDGEIYLVGAFNDWYVTPYSQLEENNGLYTITANLKRGRYDYQYVTGEEYDGVIENIDWFIYEGNFFETTNTYTVLLYYKSKENGEYEQIISHKIISTGGI